MENTTNLNLNNSQCIQKIENLGYNTYQNICDNTFHRVNWGSADWFGIIVALAGIIWSARFLYRLYRDN